jgi:CDP-glycerol glycerophosphotransferase (TagB/SpsB family)
MAHGSAFGVYDYSLQMAMNQKFDVYLGLSEAERHYVMTHSSQARKDEQRIRVVGFPKCDALVSGHPGRDVVLQSLGLPLNRQTILITSHWERESLLRRLNRRILPAALELARNYNVILTGHPKLWGKAPCDLAEERTRFLAAVDDSVRTAEFLRFVPSANVEILLATADLLVGDQSSVVTAYSLLDRPILFFDNPDFTFFEGEVFDIYRRASTPFVDPADLPGLCRASLSQPEREAAGRRTMREYFFAHPGTAAKRTAEVLVAASAHVSQSLERPLGNRASRSKSRTELQ